MLAEAINLMNRSSILLRLPDQYWSRLHGRPVQFLNRSGGTRIYFLIKMGPVGMKVDQFLGQL